MAAVTDPPEPTHRTEIPGLVTDIKGLVADGPMHSVISICIAPTNEPTMTYTPAISTSALTKRYGGFEALVALDLDVRPGEVFGFLGPNGSGKTTMIRMLTDEIRPSAGSATILGLDCQRDTVAVRHHLGYLPGDLALYPKLTGRETLTYFANLRGGVDWAFVDSLAERLDSDLSRHVGEMSTGNRQKVGLIQAFMNKPDLIIMDEPSTGLDPLVQAEFQTMVREVADDGRTVFLSSHTLSEVQRVADRVGIIRHGHLIAVETIVALQAKAVRRVELRFATPVEATTFESVPGVRSVEVDEDRVSLRFDGAMSKLLDVVRDGPPLVDIATHDPSLEETFLTYYRDDDASVPLTPGAGAGA
ncbi:MAG: ABC-2 type transport system ATP-binding protein [Nitriliruptoraceae bacterium]|jgi:ABC-2 type transport system ATP-binding protein